MRDKSSSQKGFEMATNLRKIDLYHKINFMFQKNKKKLSDYYQNARAALTALFGGTEDPRIDPYSFKFAKYVVRRWKNFDRKEYEFMAASDGFLQQPIDLGDVTLKESKSKVEKQGDVAQENSPRVREFDSNIS